MKKLGLYTMALLSMGLVACNQDFETEFVPQTNPQQSLLQVSDVSVQATVPGTIDLSDYIDEEAGTDKNITIGTVSVAEGKMPANSILKAVVEFSKDADFSNSISLNANSLDGSNEISVKASELQDAYFNNITRNPAATPLYMRTVLYTVTDGTSEAIVGKPEENFFAESNVQFTPLFKVQISPAYYVIGAAGGWSADGARTQKFSHSDADVYDDPIFTVIVDAGGDDCWFAIGDDTAIDAVEAGDWNQLFGTKGASEDLTGTMDRRTNLGGDHSFHVTGAKKIRITLDMMEYSYKIEPVNIADAYYLIGGPGEWSATSAMTMQFSHSAKDVFEDPVFTYTFEGSGSDMWFAFGDKDAIDAIGNDNDWSKLFGTTGESTDLSGSFDRRYNLDGDHSFCVDGQAKFYRVSINMAEMTYTITPLNFAEYLWEAGVNNNWGSDAQPLYCEDGNGTYKGFFYAQDADWSNGMGAFKFQTEFNNWEVTNYGIGSGDDESGTLSVGGDNIMVTPGFYYAEINLADLTYKLTSIKSIGIIGPAQAGGWNDDTDMTYNPETRAWEATIELAADEYKFRANDAWDINWGGSEDNLTANGANLKVAEAGTYFVQLFATCETKSYCTITKK
ncbi:MAG: DUF5115 domain-containing protein [Prevotella sp.]|nr:DUF5115 domain-containing protein [Prevotella sp.]